MGFLKLFNRKEREPRTSAFADGTAQKIADFILGVQRRLAVRVNLWFARMGVKRATYLLIFVGVVFWCYCLYVLLGAIIN